MNVGQPNRTYIDATGHIEEQVTTNEKGIGKFLCPAGSVSVWVPL
jgi:alpha-amylase